MFRLHDTAAISWTLVEITTRSVSTAQSFCLNKPVDIADPLKLFVLTVAPKMKLEAFDTGDAKSTTSYSLDLHFSVFQNRLDRV